MIVNHTTADGRKLSVEVREATVRDMLLRTTHMQSGVVDAQAAEDADQPELFRGLMRLNTFPSCVSCSTSFQDSEDPEMTLDAVTFEVFLGVPQQFMTKWVEKAYELNPSWSPEAVVPQVRPSDEPEKNKSDLTND